MEDVKTLKDYINIIRRRKFIIAGPFFALLIISTVVIMLLPPVYESQATILIEQQHIPTDLIKSTVTSYADERIKLIEQKIMTVVNIGKIMDKYNLYQDQKKKLATYDLVELFKENTHIGMVNANLVNQGKNNKAAIAFNISWSDRRPDVAQKVTNELVTLFLDENVRARTQRAEETTAFLAEEVEKLKNEIQKIETAIAEYKQKYSSSLPELLPVNLSAINRLETELQQLDLKEKMLSERRISLNSQLLSTSPVVVSTATVKNNAKGPTVGSLEELQATESSLLSKYSPSHPDVIQIRRQIEILKRNGSSSSAQESAELAEARLQMLELKKKYSDNHPDVKKLQKRIADLEKNTSSDDKTTTSTANQGINNPVYLQLKSELDIAQIELENIKTQRATTQQKLQTLEANVAQSHQVERGYFELMRDLDSNKAKYQELKGKQLQAQLSQSLEEEQKAESFTLIEPPQLPSKPIKPNRMKLLVLGFALSMGGGLGAGFLVEMLNNTIRGARSLSLHTGLEPLIVIPYIPIQADLDRTRRHWLQFWFAVGVLIVLTIIAVHIFYMPLDTLFYKVWQQLESL